MITYSRMTEKALRGESIGMTVSPVQNFSGAEQQSTISVSYRQSILWIIPLDECDTWLVSPTGDLE